MMKKSSKWFKVLFLSAASLVLIAAAGFVMDIPGAFETGWWLIGSGGGSISGGDYTLESAIGEPVIGTSSGGDYSLASGYAAGIVEDPLIAFPEMDVQGGGSSIVDGDNTPTTEDDTDFGSVDVTSGSDANIFTIENTGDANLNLAGIPKVVISGTHAADFTVTSQPISPVAPSGGTTTFEITFDPSAEGLRVANVSIANDDSDENPYDFSIQGTGMVTCGPEMDVQGSGQSIADGDATPSLTDDTDFGSADVSSGSVAHTFTIVNAGDVDLNLTGSSKVQISGIQSADFTVTSLPSSPVAFGGGTTTFEITFNPSAAGLREAEVSIDNDDSDENPYNYKIQGTGTVPATDDTIGMYSRGQKTWYLKDANTDGWANVSTVRFGSVDTSWLPVEGDWNGDGSDTIGMYSRTQKTWYLKDANTDGWGDVSTVRFGSTDSSWIPVVGDWNGNGTDTIGIYSRSQKTWYLKDTNTDGWGDVSTVRFGSTDSSWIPVVGDWNGNGTDTIAMYSRTQKTWYLKGGNTDGWGDVSTVRFGSTDSSWIPVAGDWDGDSTDTIGMYSRTQKTWYLKDANDDGWGNVTTVRFGSTDASWLPVKGKW